MVRLPQDLEEKRLRLVTAARRGAFDSYVRYGRVPKLYERIATAVSEAKALNDDVALPAAKPVRPAGRPTTHYVWRSAGDNRVRDTHAARDGRIFAWADPPEHGHPGTEPNCRCWPEPYYGDPAVPDALLDMVRDRRVSTDTSVLWASIETLTRPDGSLSASHVVMNDGAQIQSTFIGSTAISRVRLPGGGTVRVESQSGTNTIYAGDDAVPVLQTTWTVTGPAVTRTRRQLAFLMDDPLGPDIYFDPIQFDLSPGTILDPDPMAGLFTLDGSDGPGIIGAAFLALYLMRQAEPATMGAGERDAAYVAFRAWTNAQNTDGTVIPVPIAIGSITEEQARESCKLLPDVQAWTDQAALTLAMDHTSRDAQNYGIQLHKIVKGEVDVRKKDFPLIYRGVYAEYSITASGELGRYGERETRRLDVIEEIPPEDPSVVCDYEVKTGAAELGGRQLAEYVERLARRYPGATIFVFQVKPTSRPPR